MAIPILDPSKPIVDENGKMQPDFMRVMRLLVELDMKIGTGTPEGNEEGGLRRLYMDDGAAAGSILYIKQATDVGGDTKKGWELA